MKMKTFEMIGALVMISATAAAQAPSSDTPKYPPGLYAVINTSVGAITAQLYEKDTPVTVRAFVGLARGTQPWLDPKTRKTATHPLYENLIFHRVIPDFMIQTGDPTATGAYDCGFKLPDEFLPGLKFDRPGRVAMANAGPGTAACQFFITEDKYAAGNGKYTIFGQVVDGQRLVSKISHVIRDSKDKPTFPMKLINISIMRVAPPAAPTGDAPAKPATEPQQ
jgi:peptidyl-prolyl cis-trans isomerase A (cyclophilin A)